MTTLQGDSTNMIVTMSRITSKSNTYSRVCLGWQQIEHQNTHCWPFAREIHRYSVDSPHKWPVVVLVWHTHSHRYTWSLYSISVAVLTVDQSLSTLLWLHAAGVYCWVGVIGDTRCMHAILEVTRGAVCASSFAEAGLVAFHKCSFV